MPTSFRSNACLEWFAALCTSLLFISYGFHGQWLLSILYALIAGLFGLATIKQDLISVRRAIRLTNLLLLTLASLIGLLAYGLSHHTHCFIMLSVYLTYACLVFWCLPFRIAIFFVGLFSVALTLLTFWIQPTMGHLLFWLVFLAATLLAGWQSLHLYRGGYHLHSYLLKDYRTQLPNQRKLEADLDHALKRGQREKTLVALSCVEQRQVPFSRSDIQMIQQHLEGFDQLYCLSPTRLCLMFPLGEAGQLGERIDSFKQLLPGLSFSQQLCQPEMSISQMIQHASQLHASPIQPGEAA